MACEWPVVARTRPLRSGDTSAPPVTNDRAPVRHYPCPCPDALTPSTTTLWRVRLCWGYPPSFSDSVDVANPSAFPYFRPRARSTGSPDQGRALHYTVMVFLPFLARFVFFFLGTFLYISCPISVSLSHGAHIFSHFCAFPHVSRPFFIPVHIFSYSSPLSAARTPGRDTHKPRVRVAVRAATGMAAGSTLQAPGPPPVARAYLGARVR